MTRVRKVFTSLLPAMLTGGVLFGSAFGHASAGRDDDPDPWASPTASSGDPSGSVRRVPAPRTAQAPRRPPVPPAPPVPPGGWHGAPPPPAPPVPPARGRQHGGISVTINNGKVQVAGIDEFARQQIDSVRHMLHTNPNIPPDVRDRILARMDRARASLDRRLKNLSVSDIDQLGDEMEKMGDELEKAMEGLEEEMEKLGDKLGKDFSKEFAKDFAKNFNPGSFKFDFSNGNDRGPRHPHDPDDEGDDDETSASIPMMPDVEVDAADGDLRDAIDELRDIALKPDQRQKIVMLRTSSDRTIAAAKKQLDDVTKRLETALGDVRTSDADISRYVDQISQHEAAIRKTRLLAWVQARRVLDDSQRKKIEAAAAKKNNK